MNNTTKRNISRLIRIGNAWEKVAPTATFAGMTLKQFQDAVASTFAQHDELAATETEIKAMRRTFIDTSRKSNALGLAVVSSVRGDLNFGPDSPLYSAFGYVRDSERGANRNNPSAPAAPNAETVKG